MRTAAVVGAGIGGLAAAIALRNRGWDVTVLERWPQIVDLGTAIGLWPDAQRALGRLGVGDQIQAVGVPYRTAHVRTPKGRRIAPLPLERIERSGGAPVLMVPRTTLIRTLANALPAKTIHTGITVDRPTDLPHDLIVAADGYRSTIRTAVAPQTRTRYLGFVAIRGVVDGEFGPYGEVWGRGILVGVTPVERGRTNFYVALRAPQHTRPTLDDLRERLAHYPEPIPTVLGLATDVLRHDVHDLAPALRTYVHRNVALLGDAAHAMAPSLGQGACQALIDADCLATNGLENYDELRRRPTQRLARASRLLSRIQT
ncbi:FAD-dependent monooxygenase [Cryptosporangium phraense]|uniref:FAD-binding protein n=1 Tax=Cryptosporangium phraense TaxID=2593070 RepID=A0A545AM96_9ACTN|nr:FAD-dependent monooxygenase [Cryptosporangium phraense]TQS42459.1 FAD-binding protein [Cryptosporangium phraense]